LIYQSWASEVSGGSARSDAGRTTVPQYVGLDVSDRDTAIHVLDEGGRLPWRGKRSSEPDAIAAALRRHAPQLERVGLETGQLAPWLYHSLKDLDFPVVCLDARHARAATALQRNKTDAYDAETLGAVCIHRSQIMAHARCTKPIKAERVFSHRKAILRKRLSLLKKHST